MNRNLVTLLMLAVGLTTAGLMWRSHRASPMVRNPMVATHDVGSGPGAEGSTTPSMGRSAEIPVASSPLAGAPLPRMRPARELPVPKSPPAAVPPKPRPTEAVKDAAQPAPGPPNEVSLPRLALSLVGTDVAAEGVWAAAINDPDRPAKERQDLIEDLNEDGFPDPKHPTADDLPVILNRLDLIERLAPEAMDEVNAAAFAEAYKDLVGMIDKVTGR